jgi:hypothetical protein
MKAPTTLLQIPVTLVLLAGLLAGCMDEGGGSVHGSVYYGASFNDPWYHGPDYYPPAVIVTPPPGRPEAPPRPSQPIARPPSPRPMPSIPSTPRPSVRR